MTQNDTAHRRRRVRGLLGHLDEGSALNFLLGGRSPLPGEDVAPLRQRWSLAATARSAPPCQAAVRPLPTALHGHVQQITATPLFTNAYLGLATEWAMVELASLRAFQPTINLSLNGEIADDRVLALPDSPSLEQLFSVSCPLPTQVPFEMRLEPGPAWTVISANPNLSLLPWHDPQQGLIGFAVAAGTPWMCASRFGGVLILRDGYHRAAAFLRRGISAVPMLIVNCPTYSHVGGLRPGCLPEPTVLGSLPPTVGDFMTTALTADLEMPHFRKVIRLRPDDFAA